jgi:hypothetical protein
LNAQSVSRDQPLANAGQFRSQRGHLIDYYTALIETGQASWPHLTNRTIVLYWGRYANQER